MDTGLHSVALTLKQPTVDTCLRWRLQDTYVHVWVSILWGHCSFLLGPDVYKVLFLPSKCLFPQSCASSCGSRVRLMATSFKRSHAGTAAYSAPNLAAGHHPPTPALETPGHSRASLGQTLVGSLLLYPGSWCAQVSVCAIQKSISQSCISSGDPVVALR